MDRCIKFNVYRCNGGYFVKMLVLGKGSKLILRSNNMEVDIQIYLNFDIVESHYQRNVVICSDKYRFKIVYEQFENLDNNEGVNQKP